MAKGPFGPRPYTHYKMRHAATGRDKKVRAYFSVPDWIAKVAPEDQEYEVILTDQGILYRPTNPEPVTLPDWVKKDE